VVYLMGPSVDAAGKAEEFFKQHSGRQTNSMGSGFFIHESGYVITNAHAVEKVIQIYATLSNGMGYDAELVGMARDKDLALLKVDPGRPVRALPLARSGDVLVGETVVVIGNPGGLIDTCTAGILSATGRDAASSGLPGITLHNLLQTDAAINQGSSGGPWFNVLGQVIGVTAAIKVGAQNIGFAVPVDAVRQTLPAMLDAERRYGLVTGIEFRGLEPCTVGTVAAASPAAQIGLKPGDVLTKLDARPLYGRADFELGLIDRKPGEAIKLQLLRKEKLFETSLVPAARPKPNGRALLEQLYGLKAMNLTREKAQVWDLRVRRGVEIIGVTADKYSNIAKPPKVGDVLAVINGIRPRDLEHVGFLLDQIKLGEPTHFILLRMDSGQKIRMDMQVTVKAIPQPKPKG
jgi:serine protease Do